ncbi:MAG: hypothetical protein K2Q97_02370 [Burkholderiaceae bacterium]|nr:hypothetical protein [Burkholderiaceae bacterium]
MSRTPCNTGNFLGKLVQTHGIDRPAMGTANALYAINIAHLTLRGAGQHLAWFEKIIQHTIQTDAYTDSKYK